MPHGLNRHLATIHLLVALAGAADGARLHLVSDSDDDATGALWMSSGRIPITQTAASPVLRVLAAEPQLTPIRDRMYSLYRTYR